MGNEITIFFLIGSWFNIWILHTESHWCQDSRSVSTWLVTWAVPRHQLCPFIWVGQVPLIVHMTGHSRMTWIYFITLPLILFSNSEWVFCFCPWFLPWTMTLVTSPIRFLTLSGNLWLSLGDGPSNASEVIIIRMLLEADISYVISVQSCIVVDVRPPSHLTNMGHLSPKGLNINIWMETSKFIIIPRKTIL